MGYEPVYVVFANDYEIAGIDSGNQWPVGAFSSINAACDAIQESTARAGYPELKATLPPHNSKTLVEYEVVGIVGKVIYPPISGYSIVHLDLDRRLDVRMGW